MERVAILGSGMAGWGAAYRLHQEGIPSVTYDKNNYHGGYFILMGSGFGRELSSSTRR